MATEREVKVDVDDDFTLPPFDALAGISAQDRGEHVLDATYWDTDDLALLRAGVGLRRRTTDGSSPTWTVKSESTVEGAALVRDEIDINSESERPPAALSQQVSLPVEVTQLRPVVRISTRRHIIDLVDAAGGRWAEVADDRVTVLDPDGREVSAFREVEVEVTGEADEERLNTIVDRLYAAGARPPVLAAKYVKGLAALGRQLPGKILTP